MEYKSLQLLEGHPFRLKVYGEGGDRFVAIFQRCWGQIQEIVRQRLLDYWSKSGHADLPSFEFSTLWHDSKISDAQVGSRGYELRFSASSFCALPEPVALFKIAHELAHVYRHARGMSQFDESTSVSEDTADGLAGIWGFDKDARDAFKQAVSAHGFEKACQLWREIGKRT
jgi:hypothetical protein